MGKSRQIYVPAKCLNKREHYFYNLTTLAEILTSFKSIGKTIKPCAINVRH